VHSLSIRLALLAVVLAAASVTPDLGLGGHARAASVSPVRYAYDAAGRLTGVADTKANEAAVYHYDRAGNITSITRVPAGILSAQSRRQRPGVVSGLTSEPHLSSVTSAGNAVTSAKAGTTVTVNGSNFDPTVSGDVVRFGGTVAQVLSATTTEVTVFVPPNSGAGPVSVTTPHGTGTSAFDFFVPPGAYTSPQVGVASTLSNGKASTVNLSTAGKVALLAVPATADPRANALEPERMSITLANATLSAYQVSVYDAQNRLVYGPRGFNASTNGFAFDLATSGIYTIVVDPGTSTGSVQVTSTLFKDVSVPISAATSQSAPSTRVTIPVSGQNALLPFNGVAGELVSATLTNSTVAGQNWGIETASSGMLNQTFARSGTDFLDRTTLPATGKYYIFCSSLSAYWPDTGSFDVNLYRLTDPTGQVPESTTFPGAAKTLTTTLPGEDARLTFKGDAGQSVSVLMSNPTPNSSYTVSVLAPDYSTLESNSCVGACFLDRITLPQSGTYKIFLTHSGQSTFSVSTTLYRISDAKKAIKTSSSPVRLRLGPPSHSRARSVIG